MIKTCPVHGEGVGLTCVYQVSDYVCGLELAAADKQYPTSALGQADGAAGPDRPKPCTQRTWCVLLADHLGRCVEVPSAALKRQAWDTRTRDPIGWNDQKRNRGEE